MRLPIGALDLHVHSYPDLMPRSVDDLQLARLARDSGMAGFVLKSHYAPTAERAWLVRQVVPEIRAVGSIVLNHFVGGLNPLAVEALARAGGRVIYMPTSDAANEADVLNIWDPGRELPPYLQIKQELIGKGRLGPPISLLDDAGELSRETLAVLEVIRDYDLVLATGHISRDETLKLAQNAHAAGIGRIVVTHPESPHIDIGVEEQLSLLQYGVVFERCFAYLQEPDVLRKAFAAVHATGVSNNVLSSDLGAVTREDPVAGLRAFAELARNSGFSDVDVQAMFAVNPSRLLGHC
ncbi:DUF6282 family protein [Blastococcus saxobsidens]|uniref:Cytosolic protein n=1 Tax=Blastococcus saxobsidens (strain DD2) TaxID=1146883 RepID=H6RNR6_BLASD|nr:DUF6282 family protein [Blastococcus saxobsidens]CCG05214.1 conserved protein of unknown function [Blastococcus saxobsidens DD2]